MSALHMLCGRAVAVALLLAFAGSATAEEPLHVRFGIHTVVSQTAFLVGARKGIFARHGFDLDVRPIQSGAQASQAMAAGQLDWTGAGIEATVVAWANDVGVVAGPMYAKNGDTYAIVARAASGVRTAADLRGKTIAVPAGTSPAQGLNRVLDEAGVPLSAIRRVNAPFPAAAQMLVQGAVDAMANADPFVTVALQTMGDQAVLVTRLGRYVQGGGFFLVSRAWAQAHADKLPDAALALAEAQKYVRDHPDEAIQLEAEYLHVAPEIVRSALAHLDFDPTIDTFTLVSARRTAEFLRAEGVISRSVDIDAELAGALRLNDTLARQHPELLK